MKKILVVDDEENFRSLLVWLLQQEGYEVIEADNGDSALEIARTQRPDLVISDVVMMGINGFVLRESLREDPRTASIPVVLMTGKAADAGAWESSPDTEYMTKPFPASAVVAVAQNLLGTAGKG